MESAKKDTKGSLNMSEIDERDTSNFERIGEGDDGVVFKTVSAPITVAIKVYVSRILRGKRPEAESTNSSSNVEPDFYKEISNDQANREIKALTLLKGHDNFMKLALDSLNKITFLPANGAIRLLEIPSIHLVFVPNLYEVEYVTDFFGFKLGDYSTLKDPPHLKTRNSMNFEHRNLLFKYTMHQIYDATIYMHALNIQHRDLDICNVKMVYPDFQVKIMDFARADVPSLKPFPDSENPYGILQTAKIMLRNLKNERGKGREEELWKYCIRQYENPINDNQEITMVPRFKEYSDKMEITYLLNRILTYHLRSFEWSQDSIHQETIIQENDLLAKFISHCHSLSLIQARELTAVDRKKVSKIPRDDTTFVDGYINTILIPHTRSVSTFKREYLRHPRIVIHSSAWNSRYGTNLMTSPL